MNKIHLQKLLPYLFSVLVPIVVCLFFFTSDFSKQIKPDLEHLDKRVSFLERQNIDSIRLIINEMYFLSRGNSTIKVGINANLKGGDATIFKNEDFDFLEVDAYFYLTNPRNPLRPCIEIKVIEQKSKTDSDADLFIGYEAADMLGIKGDMLNIGVFNMGIKKVTNGY